MSLAMISQKGKKIDELKVKAVTGFSLLIGREMMMKVIAVIGQLALVRILRPDLFGAFAIISFVLGLSELFTDLGLSVVIIQKKNQLKQSELSSIFLIKFSLTIIVVCLLLFLGPYLSKVNNVFGHTEILILRILSLTLIVKSSRTIIFSLLERDLRYKAISTIDLVGMVIYYLVALVLAVMNFGIWSFAYAVIFKEITETVIAWCFSPWFPSKISNISEIWNLLKLGIYYQMGFFSAFIYQSTIPVVAGILSTPYNVGLLDWSSNAASIPRTISENIGRVSFASFSKIQDDKEMIGNLINKSFVIVSFFSMFLTIVAITFSKELVPVFLNARWLPAVPALNWFIGSAFFLNGTALLGNIIFALGKNKIMFYSSLMFIFLEYTVAIILFHVFGFTGIAIANFFVTAIMFLYLIFLTNKEGIKVRLTSELSLQFIIGLMIFALTIFLNSLLPKSLIMLIIKLSVFSIVYLIIFKIFLPTTVDQFIKLIKTGFKK